MKHGGPLKRHTPLKRGGSLRRQSSKTAALERKARGARVRWKNEAGCCMLCGHSSRNPWPDKPLACSKLEAHEICNGTGYRLRALDKPWAVLIACSFCNQHVLTKKAVWPEARQLCLLLVRAIERYNLIAYLEFTSPQALRRITQEEVEAYLPTIPQGA